ncbi:MAG TPA: 50S ribosomal protein L14e [archaeon]|nr:50S ribosomal protein L14e [archaeon]
MKAIEPGRVCIKTAGRSAGKRVVVLSVEGNYALIDGPGLKRKKCNISHLEPLPQSVKAGKQTNSEEVMELLKSL